MKWFSIILLIIFIVLVGLMFGAWDDACLRRGVC